MKKNPWKLADDVDGIGFLKADEIAKSLNIPADSPERLKAAAVFAMNTLTTRGHVCAPESEVIQSAAELLKLPEESAKKGVDEAIAGKLLLNLDNMIYPPHKENL